MTIEDRIVLDITPGGRSFVRVVFSPIAHPELARVSAPSVSLLDMPPDQQIHYLRRAVREAVEDAIFEYDRNLGN